MTILTFHSSNMYKFQLKRFCAKQGLPAAYYQLFLSKNRSFSLKVLLIRSYIYSDLFFNVFLCICCVSTSVFLLVVPADSKSPAQLFRVLSRLAHLISEMHEIISLWFTLFPPYLRNILHIKKKSTSRNLLPCAYAFLLIFF